MILSFDGVEIAVDPNSFSEHGKTFYIAEIVKLPRGVVLTEWLKAEVLKHKIDGKKIKGFGGFATSYQHEGSRIELGVESGDDK